MKRQKGSSIVLWVTVLQAAALVATGCSHEPAPAGPVVSVQTALAVRKPIDELVSSDAVLYPWKAAAITPKITAPVRKFYVQRGDRVHAGELLATLENRDLAAAVLENQGSYEQAQATFASTTEAGLPEEMQKAELDLRRRQTISGCRTEIV